MQTEVQKCPGGVAVMVPYAIATLAGLADGRAAALEGGGQLLVRAANRFLFFSSNVVLPALATIHAGEIASLPD